MVSDRNEAPMPRPSVMRGATERLRTGHGNVYVTINFAENGKPFEVFTTLGKANGCDSAHLEAISRLVSLALQSGIEPKAIVEQLRGITCDPAWDGGTLIRSVPDAVALALSRHLQAQGHPDGLTHEGTQLPLFTLSRYLCPECESPLAFQEGTVICHTCGWNDGPWNKSTA